MNRNNLLVKILRKAMRFNPLGVATMKPFHSILPFRNVGQIYIIGAPRSGTTITYQKLLKTFNVKYLDNFLHLVFGIPFLRGLSNQFAPSQAETSTHGFVGGARGAAEGLHFWKYWMGYDTTFRATKPHQIKSGLQKYVDYLEINRRPFLSCYIPMLGHVEEILINNPNAFVILLKREFKDIEKSLLKCYQDNNTSHDGWFSLHPEGNYKGSYEEKVDIQVKLYRQLLEKDERNVGLNVMILTYEQVKEFSSETKEEILAAYNKFAVAKDLSKLKER